MKTSILVSSFAALCLLLTFAEAPRRHGEDKRNVEFTTNMTLPNVDRVTMLPGVFITADRKKEAHVTVPLVPAEDFSYLKFNVNEYLDANSVNYDDADVLPSAVETDFSYLRFDVGDFIADSELNGDEIAGLPVNEENITLDALSEPAVDQFEYLRFDVNKYVNNQWTDSEAIGELPVIGAETANHFSNLKFDVTKYFSTSVMSSEAEFELPEE